MIDHGVMPPDSHPGLEPAPLDYIDPEIYDAAQQLASNPNAGNQANSDPGSSTFMTLLNASQLRQMLGSLSHVLIENGEHGGVYIAWENEAREAPRVITHNKTSVTLTGGSAKLDIEPQTGRPYVAGVDIWTADTATLQDMGVSALSTGAQTDTSKEAKSVLESLAHGDNLHRQLALLISRGRVAAGMPIGLPPETFLRPDPQHYPDGLPSLF